MSGAGAAIIVGTTGLVGNYFLRHSPEYYQKVISLSRREPDNSSDPKITKVLKPSEEWISYLDSLDAPVDTFISSLGTTKGKVGGFENQYKIDHDLNLELAKAAKAKGIRNYVLVSSANASSSSKFAYFKMKGTLEEEVIKLGFDKTVILRPGILLGERAENHGFWNEFGLKAFSWTLDTPLAPYLGKPVRAEDVALAGLKTVIKSTTDKVVILDGLEVNEAAKK